MRLVPGTADLRGTERIVLFDGECNLCNGFVQFLVRRDPKARLRFAALQSRAAQQLLKGRRPADDDMDTVIYLRKGHVLVRSTAALFILRDLGGGWGNSSIFLAVPRPIRDAAYRWVARNRYSWFGKRDRCMVPTPELQSRFLEP